jgi:bifunctional UDP-N-acetylglucosamine pyrophosphorylase/glucosamine-1-phosphate N-acetyltransferase
MVNPVGPLTALVLATEASPDVDVEPVALRRLCGRPLLAWTLDALRSVPTQRTVVVTGAGGELVAKGLQDHGVDLYVEFLEQRVPRGDGGAVGLALTALPTDHTDGTTEADVVVVPAWLPLLGGDALANLVDAHRLSGASATLLTTTVQDPAGHTVVARDERGRLAELFLSPVDPSHTPGEYRPAPEGHEVFTGVFVARVSELAMALRRVSSGSFDGRVRLERAIELLQHTGLSVSTRNVGAAAAVLAPSLTGSDLARFDAELAARTVRKWLDRGVIIDDPRQVRIEATVQLGVGVRLAPGTVLEGSTVVAAGSRIGPNTHLTDCMVGARAAVEASVGRDAEVGDGAVVGPFATLEPGASVAPGQRTGPYFHAQSSAGRSD